MTEKYPLYLSPLAAILILCGLTITITSSIIVLTLAKHDNDRTEKALILSCERGNLLRERQNMVVSKLQFGLPPLPIVDCSKIFDP